MSLWDDPGLARSATGDHMATDDYPEFDEIVDEYLPPEIYRSAAGPITWMKNQMSDFIDDTLLESDTNWCRYRTRDGHCGLPGALDLQGTVNEGHAVWQVVDRGPCIRNWPQQMSCPLGEAGPDISGAPSPVPYEQGGQRGQPIETTRPL